MNIPTAKTIETRLTWLSRAGDPKILAKQVREELEDLRRISNYWHPKEIDVLRTLERLNALLCCYGVESIVSRQNVRTSYLNTGDAYAPTICYNHSRGTIAITSWGDIVERHMNDYQ